MGKRRLILDEEGCLTVSVRDEGTERTVYYVYDKDDGAAAKDIIEAFRLLTGECPAVSQKD